MLSVFAAVSAAPNYNATAVSGTGCCNRVEVKYTGTQTFPLGDYDWIPDDIQGDYTRVVGSCKNGNPEYVNEAGTLNLGYVLFNWAEPDGPEYMWRVRRAGESDHSRMQYAQQVQPVLSPAQKNPFGPPTIAEGGHWQMPRNAAGSWDDFDDVTTECVEVVNEDCGCVDVDPPSSFAPVDQ